QLSKHFERKKCDLSFVIRFVIEKAVAANAVSSHALYFLHFDHRKIVRRAAVMAEEIVTGRNVKMTDFHRAKCYHRHQTDERKRNRPRPGNSADKRRRA